MKIAILLFFISFFSFSQNRITTIEITKFLNFNPQEKNKLIKIIKNINEIINSAEFRDQVVNHRINDSYRFEDNNNQTNEEILRNILAGAEDLTPQKDYIWNLTLRLQWMFTRNTLGYTYGSAPDIYISSRHFKKSSEPEIAGTICHEYMHKIGYNHTKEYTSKRPNTVPYAVGSICESLYINNFGIEYAERKTCGPICRLADSLKSYFSLR